MLTAAPIRAAEWLIVPGARTASEYVQNPRLMPKDGEDDATIVGEAYAQLAYATEVSKLSLSPRILASRFESDSNLDYDNRSLGADYNRAWETWKWATSANFVQDTTLTSELGRTGFVEANRVHEAASLSFGPTFTLSERAQFGLQGQGQKTHYRDALGTGLVDYNYVAGSGFVSCVYSESTQLSLTVRAGELRVPDVTGADKQDAAVRIGWNYSDDGLWSYNASAGPSYMKSEFLKDDGYVYQVGVKRAGERTMLSASLSRDVTPTGRGALTRSDQLYVELDRGITERLHVTLSINGVRNEDQLNQSGFEAPKLTYATANLGWNWQVAEQWSLSFSVSGSTQKYSNVPGSGDSYRASIGIVWNGQPRIL